METATVIPEEGWEVSDSGSDDHRDGVPLLFLPGIAGGADVFHHQMEAFRGRARVIAVSYPADLTTTVFCSGLVRILGQLGVEKISLIGTSLGGYLAAWFALCHPQRVDQLVLVNAFIEPGRLPALSVVPVDHLMQVEPRRHRMLSRCDRPIPQVRLAAMIDCEDDHVVGAAERLRLRHSYPHARVYSLSSGGHMPFLTSPQIFNRILEDELM
jgi:pimeloyl-ACP methyl ester carboxylesterase